MDRFNVLIAGGGIIGTSVAWSLASRGVNDIAVVDLDLAGVYASSELNAGGARASWFQNSFGLDIEVLCPSELPERFPLLDRGLSALVGATHSPRDGLLNPNAVRLWYRREAEALGVTFLNRHYVGGVVTRRTGAGGRRFVDAVDVAEVEPGDPFDTGGMIREILTTHRVPPKLLTQEIRIRCATVVNCLGAWSPVFSAKIGVSDVTEPVRRQISLVDVRAEDRAPGVDFESLGMIVDASNLYSASRIQIDGWWRTCTSRPDSPCRYLHNLHGPSAEADLKSRP